MINPIGIITVTTFLTIWFGHVMVRKLESRLVRIAPAVILCILLGFGFVICALLVESNRISAIFGIVGITFLWDALEFYRQEKRIKVGHAPANPKNPRHRRHSRSVFILDHSRFIESETKEKSIFCVRNIQFVACKK